MAVLREFDIKNYSVDANGQAITDDTKRRICTCHDKDRDYVPVVRRCYPIDKYTIPQSLASARQVTSLRILKVPLLGQAGFRYYWCGRTAAAMVYNWFQLVRKDNQSPKQDYVTHWDADDRSLRLDLRYSNKTRAFTWPKDTLDGGKPRASDYSCGDFLDQINAAAGAQKYERTTLFAYSPSKREEEGRRIAKNEKEIRERFKLVLSSIDLNNPVHFDGGLTTGCNHFVVLNGYASIVEGGEEHLWLCVANPAGNDWWLNTLNLIDATATLDKLTPAYDVINLVNGSWDCGRAAMQLVRASVFFRPKASDVPGLQTAASAADLKKFADAHALILDDIGNSNAAGGPFYYCKELTTVPSDAVLTKEQLCTFPLDIPGVATCQVPAFELEENRSASAGGFYPLGLFRNLHGGVHVPTKDAAPAKDSALYPVRAIAPGRVVAARIHHAGPPDVETANDGQEQDQKNALAREFAANSPNFVLIRHVLKVTKAGHENDPPIVFYCLYMHLSEPTDIGTGAPYGNVRWLSELNRRRLGSLVVVDSDAPLGSEKFEAGHRLWPAVKPEKSLLSQGNITTYADGPSFETRTITLPQSGDRVVLVAKDAEADLSATVTALDGGEVITYPESHRTSFVEGGSVVGYAAPAQGNAGGFVHWEVFTPENTSLRKLIEQADKEFGTTFAEFEESNPNNLLEDKEMDTIESKLPEGEVRGPRLAGKAFAQPHESAPNRKPQPGHYLVTVRARPYDKTLAPQGTTQKFKLSFYGTDKRTNERTPVEITLDFKEGTPSQVIDVPGWASRVKVSCDGYMVRELTFGQLFDDAQERQREEETHEQQLKEHVRSITKSRWRNLRMTHLNEWCAKDMLTVVKEHLGNDSNLNDSVSALSWWGGQETPAFSSAKLFGSREFPAQTKIDNIHPVTALWVINLLVERGVVSFVSPEDVVASKPSKALFAGWLPALHQRASQRVGETVQVMVIRDHEVGDCKVAVEAIDSTGAVPNPIPIGQEGRYTQDTFNVGDHFSAWGKMKVRVRHGDKEQSFTALGAPEIEVLAPALAEHNANPVKDASGRYSWNVELTDNCPRRLKGYVILRTRPKGSTVDFTLQNVGLPVEAIEVPPDPTGPRWEGDYLVGGSNKDLDVEVLKGVRWPALCKANGGKVPARVARSLLNALSELKTAYTDSEIILSELGAAGCSIVIAARATNTKGKVTTAEEHNVSLLKAVTALRGETAFKSVEAIGPVDKPLSICTTVEPPPVDSTPGGTLRLDFNPTTLFGTALAVLEPKPDERFETQLGCRFVNGGHVLHQSSTATDESEATTIDWGSNAKAVKGFPFLEVWSANTDAMLCMPALGPVSLSYESSGVRVRVPLLGDDAAFWRAAAMEMKAVGVTPELAPKKATPTTEVSAVFTFSGPKSELEGKQFKVEIKNTKAAMYHGSQIAAGALSATTEFINTKPEVTSVTIDPTTSTPQGKEKVLILAVTAEVHGISAPWGLRVWITDPNSQRVPLAGQVDETTWSYTAADGTKGTYLVAGSDRKARARISLKVSELLKRFPTGAKLQVYVGRDANMGGTKWPAGETKNCATWEFVPPS